VKSLLNHPRRDEDLRGETLGQIVQRVQATRDPNGVTPCWPRIMQVGVIADAEIRHSDIQQSIACRMYRMAAVWRYPARAAGRSAYY
jgi:hypothetical protein